MAYKNSKLLETNQSWPE